MIGRVLQVIGVSLLFLQSPFGNCIKQPRIERRAIDDFVPSGQMEAILKYTIATDGSETSPSDSITEAIQLDPSESTDGFTINHEDGTIRMPLDLRVIATLFTFRQLVRFAQPVQLSALEMLRGPRELTCDFRDAAGSSLGMHKLPFDVADVAGDGEAFAVSAMMCTSEFYPMYENQNY